MTGDGYPKFYAGTIPTVAELIAHCTPGRFVAVPSMGYPGGVSYEQEYICAGGITFTVHWIIRGSKIEHFHVRPGPPKGSVER
jgi:hypothetical protein